MAPDGSGNQEKSSLADKLFGGILRKKTGESILREMSEDLWRKQAEDNALADPDMPTEVKNLIIKHRGNNTGKE